MDEAHNRVKPQWERWGGELRHHRQVAGITQTQLANSMHVASQTVSTWEVGRRAPNRTTVQEMDKLLSTGGALEQLWLDLKDTGQIPASWRDLTRLEQEATKISEYQPLMMPGLLQVHGYATYLIQQGRPQPSADQLKKLVEARLSRVKNLQHTQLSFVLDEQVVCRVLGSVAIMTEQLDRLVHMIEEGTARVSVIPRDAPQRPMSAGSFRIMYLPGGRLVGHAEHWRGQQVISAPDEVNELAGLFGEFQAEALPPRASVELIQEARRRLS